jgi:Flp pilus assembly protein TadG
MFHYPRSVETSFRRLLKCTGAGVAPIFALAIIPVVGLVGAAVDYSRANSIKAGLQSALDATALAMARAAPTLTQAQLQLQTTAYFQALFNKPEAKNVIVTSTYATTGGPQLTIKVSSTMDTMFMNVMGFSSLDIGSSTTVAWSNSRLRLALVLDTTGSMDDSGKMSAMQTATKNLLTQLQAAATTNGDIFVSIVPFSKNVNVGASNYSANWIDWADWEAEPPVLKASKPSGWATSGPGDNCPLNTSSHGFGCAPSPTSTSTTTTIPSSGAYRGYICPGTDTGGKNSNKIGIMYNGCYDSVSNPKTVGTGSHASCSGYSNCTCSGNGSSKVCKQEAYDHNWIVNAHSTWNGCVTDRGTSSAPSGDYDRRVVPATSTKASQFPAEQNAYCSAQLGQLSYNWTTMKSAVDGLYPLGPTNQPIGLVWGWQSLVGGGPISAPPTKDPQYTYNEVIVLMSDGLNTLNRWNGNGSSTSTSVDQRMFEASAVGTCANIKATGVTIYTVHVNTDSDPASTLLKNCASGADKFWMVTSASGIGSVFTQIGTQLSKLRIAK